MRPVVIAGGELTLSMLDLQFDPGTRFYQAPPHVKANGGVFLIEPHATLGDRAWNDLNGNGRQDAGEPGIPGVKVTLLDENSAAVSTTVTSAAGLYKFTHLPGGTYALHFATPSGMAPTRRDAVTGANGDAVDSDIDPATGLTIPTELARQEVDLTWDAGFVRPAEVGDFVWLDRNANGLQDAGEAGVPGVTVTLTGAGGDNGQSSSSGSAWRAETFTLGAETVVGPVYLTVGLAEKGRHQIALAIGPSFSTRPR